MRTIWKYQLRGAETAIEMPTNAQVIKAGCPAPNLPPHIWAIVDTDEPTEVRHFHLFPTGAPVPLRKDLKYIETIFMGTLVFHLFEVVPVEDL